MNVRFALLTSALLMRAVSLLGQSERCPIMARLPADANEDASRSERSWFALRQCNGETLIVEAYERHKNTPSLTVDTGSAYPALLSHSVNVLVVESRGGSSDRLIVIAFRGGKPSLALKRSVGARVQVRRTQDTVIVTAPPKTYPGADGKLPTVADEVHRFPLEH